MKRELLKWRDIEVLLSLIQKGKIKITNPKKVGAVFNCLANEIEKSLIYNQSEDSNFVVKFIQKLRLQKLIKKKEWNPSWKYPNCIELDKDTKIDLEEAILRLKIAITGFKLHTSSVAHHPLFGKLSKKDWELVHLVLASHLFQLINLYNNNKILNKNEKIYINNRYNSRSHELSSRKKFKKIE